MDSQWSSLFIEHSKISFVHIYDEESFKAIQNELNLG